MPVDDPQEMFFWVDEEDNVLGKISREEAHNGSNKIHRTVGVLVFNEENHLLLQQRSLKKDLDPGMWTISAGGHVQYGQSYDNAAKQELLEEIGLKAKLDFIGKFLVTTPVQKEWVQMYRTFVSNDQTFHTDENEVEKVMWLPKSELKEFIQKNPFSSWAAEILERTTYL
jgi:isopentenyl-diphosphate delta-isomerase type 1